MKLRPWWPVLALALLAGGCGYRLTAIERSRTDRSTTAWRAWDFPAYERLQFEASWNGVPAARFVMELVRDEAAGVDVVQVRGETIGVASFAFPYRSVGEATMPRGDPRGITAVSVGRARGKREEMEVRYDRALGVVGALRTRKGKTEEVSLADATSLDPITMIYALRRTPIVEGRPATFDVFPGDHLWRVTVMPFGTESIEVEAGAFEARKLVLRRDRLDREKKDVEAQTSEAWMSADEARVPLRMIANVPLGKLSVELVSRTVADAPPPDWKREFPDGRLPDDE